jgi:HTH-type transcriptional regulator / antitoxin HipB
MTKASDQTEIEPMTIRSAEHLRNAIRRVRKLQKLSQQELAKKAGVTQATISNIERGKASFEIDTMFLIFSALDLDLFITPRPKPNEDKKASLEGLF